MCNTDNCLLDLTRDKLSNLSLPLLVYSLVFYQLKIKNDYKNMKNTNCIIVFVCINQYSSDAFSIFILP